MTSEFKSFLTMESMLGRASCRVLVRVVQLSKNTFHTPAAPCAQWSALTMQRSGTESHPILPLLADHLRRYDATDRGSVRGTLCPPYISCQQTGSLPKNSILPSAADPATRDPVSHVLGLVII